MSVLVFRGTLWHKATTRKRAGGKEEKTLNRRNGRNGLQYSARCTLVDKGQMRLIQNPRAGDKVLSIKSAAGNLYVNKQRCREDLLAEKYPDGSR